MTRPQSGEPYELAGRRIAFTSWFLVRPGSFAWIDAEGRNVTVSGSQGPWEARFTRSDYPRGVRLAAQPAERVGERIITGDRPWDSTGIAITTLLRDGERYRAWGTCSGPGGGGFCYFESTDGATWARPTLDQVQIEGQPTNLIGFAEGTVFSDPSAPAEARYKWVQLDGMSFADYDAFREAHPDRWEPRARRNDVGHAYSIIGATSPDGLHWTRLPQPLVVEHSDTQIVAYYDPRLQRYVIYTRNWWVGDQAANAGDAARPDWWSVGRRAIGRTESASFSEFPLSRLTIIPPAEWPPSDVLYTNCRTAVPGAPDHHLMFPSVWHTGDDTTSVVVYASSDGLAWDPVPGGAVFTTPPFGQWDGGCVFARPNLCELPNGDLVLPYTGYQFPHKYPRKQWTYGTGLMRWPRGRLVAIQADELGFFATVGFIAPGSRLRINALTQRAGSIRLEVARLNGETVPGRTADACDAIVGDRFRAPVTWQGADDLGVPVGTPIVLRVSLDHARIFGLDFE
jgi:hypothetical protein